MESRRRETLRRKPALPFQRSELNQKQQLSTVFGFTLFKEIGAPFCSSCSSVLQAVEEYRLPSVCLEFNLQLVSSQKTTSLVDQTLNVRIIAEFN